MSLGRSGDRIMHAVGAAALVGLAAAAISLGSGCAPDEPEQVTSAQSGRHGNANWQVDHESNGASADYTIVIPGALGEEALRIEREQPTRVRAGEPLSYDIIVTNISDSRLHEIVVEEWRGGVSVDDASIERSASQGRRQAGDEAPAGRQGLIRAASYQQQRRHAGQQADTQLSDDYSRWRIGSLAPGEAATIHVEGTAPESGTIRTCMAASFEPTICMTTRVVEPNLRLSREISDNVAYICDGVEVTYLVQNTGTAVARNVHLREQLPDGLTLAQGRDGATLDLGDIQPGATVERTLTLQARRPGRYGSFAVVGSGDQRTRSSKDSVRFVRPELDLVLDSPRSEYVGRDVPVRLVVANTSDVPAFETAVTVPGVSELAHLSLSTQQATLQGDTIQIGRLNPGESRDLTLTFEADRPGSLALTATADAYCAQEVSDDVTTKLLGIEAVRLETIDLVDPVVVGERTSYEVRVKNQGTAASIDVQVAAILPEEMTFVSGEGDSRVTAQGQQVRFAPIDRLAPGEIATWRIHARAEQPGKTQLELRLQSNAMEKPAHEQEPTTIVRQPAAPQQDQGQQGRGQQGGG